MWTFALLLSCARDCTVAGVEPGDQVCRVPGWAGRNAIVHLPAGWAGEDLPVVLAFHGGGGKKEGMERTTCADGDEDAESCLSAVADREGFAVVYPDGTPKVLGSVRSWNAGGGDDGFRCTGGRACEEDVDDMAYVDDLLDTLGAAFPLDATRVYATGISNGAAISHRLACDRADRIAAVAAVAGENMASAVPGCVPSRPVPILQIHGREDPCWMWDGTVGPCLGGEPGEDRFVSVDESMAFWAESLGCSGEGPSDYSFVKDEQERTFTVTRRPWEGCAASLELLDVDGMGHAWPGGWQYLAEEKIGPAGAPLDGTGMVVDFFLAHGLAGP